MEDSPIKRFYELAAKYPHGMPEVEATELTNEIFTRLARMDQAQRAKAAETIGITLVTLNQDIEAWKISRQ
jgi:hypothetical protein